MKIFRKATKGGYIMELENLTLCVILGYSEPPYNLHKRVSLLVFIDRIDRMNDPKSALSDPSDIWNVKSPCPKTPFKCSESSRLAPLDKFAEKYLTKRSPEYSIDKLHELISDPIASKSRPWISRLIDNFLHDIGNDGFKIQHLSGVMQILEFLAWRARDVADYQTHLDKMLDLCKLPPLLEKSSDCLRYASVMEQYFSTLGYLMVVLPTDREILRVLDAICCLLVRSKPACISAVKLELCHSAVEKSRLPTIITKLAEICSSEVYPRVLELAFTLVTLSPICCHRMLESGILDYLLTRMNTSERKEVFHGDFSNDQNPGKQELMLATNIIWLLMQSILPPKKIPTSLEKLSAPTQASMKNLQNVFRAQICHSRKSLGNITLRNDLAILVLTGLVALPSWHLVRYGLADDIVILSMVNEMGITDTWTENVVFDTSNENLFFKKIMFTILCHLSHRGAAIAIMVKRKVMPMILGLINPAIENSQCNWSPAQLRHLSQYAMRTLARLAPKMPEEFIRCQGCARLLMLIETSLIGEFDTNIVMEYTKTICSIVTAKCPLVLTNFREEGLVALAIKLINRILNSDCLTTQHQKILTLMLTIIEEIIKTEENPLCRCDDECLTIITRLLKRCFYQKKDDFPLDQRLLISIGSYIWECIICCEDMTQKFVDNGGIYTILDVIENACFPVRCIYLGILTDMCSDQCGAPHLCTWRGADKTRGFMSLLAKTWREEEIRTGVKRTSDGCIEDVELPMMGTEQWINSFHARAKHDFSPTLASMIGSVRPKIYSIRKILMNETDRYQKSKEHYKILLDGLPVEDQITMYIADHFYRFAQGEVWSEISLFLEQVGINVLGMDGALMLLMSRRHRDWGLCVRGLQDKLIRVERKRETECEREELTKIRDSKLGQALKALNEIDYLRRTTEHDYMIARKKLQCDEVNEAVQFPGDADEEDCHKTFCDKWKCTTILEQNHMIPSIRIPVTVTEPLLVSPASSDHELIPSPTIRFDDFEISLWGDKCLRARSVRKKAIKRVNNWNFQMSDKRDNY